MNNEFENTNNYDAETENAASVSEFDSDAISAEDTTAAQSFSEDTADAASSEEYFSNDAFPGEDASSSEQDSANDSSYSNQERVTPGFTVTRHPEKKKRRWPAVVALSLVSGIVFGCAFGFSSTLSTKYALSNVSIGSTDVALNKSNSGGSETNDISAITEAFMPAIVAITNRSVEDVMTFFGTYSQESTSSGSGIVIGKNDSELLIVTNHHVVANSKELSVIFSSVESKLEAQSLQGENGESGNDIYSDESIPTATVKGYNADKDLAVIAVALKDIPSEVLSEIKVATIGDSSKLRAGDRVVAIGNALGYGQSVTTGIISATNRKIAPDEQGTGLNSTFIQTDAAINPGNSGGALLNMAGEVIGINSVKIAANGIEGMGYAIPISDVSNIIDELMVKKTRKVVDEDEQGFLGITGADVSASVSQMYGIPSGVFVNAVEEGLAAEKAGIKKGYVITAFDGFTITSIAQLQDRLTYYKSGEEIEVTVQIPGGLEYKEEKIKVKLSNRKKAIEKMEE